MNAVAQRIWAEIKMHINVYEECAVMLNRLSSRIQMLCQASQRGKEEQSTDPCLSPFSR